jgi:ketosteroid isomerase-like protein
VPHLRSRGPTEAFDTFGRVAANKERIIESLEAFGEALTAGDPRAAASWWEIPALVLSDEGALPVSDVAEVEAFFAQATEFYRSQGLVATKPELERVVELTDRLMAVDVRWPTFDETGAEKASERSHYILRRGEDGQYRVRVALTRTVSP